MTRVEKTPDGHWLWTGSRMGLKAEYGQVTLGGARMGSHRAMWILLRGPIPDGLDILHQCGQSLCCNPDHVRPGTHRQNLAEALAERFGVHWAPRGENHPHAKLTAQNVRDVRAAVARGETQRTQAIRYGVSQVAISHIITGKRWRSVE